MSASRPANREQFKGYCLRALGDSVIEVNVSDQQVDDRVDEALDMYKQYHYAGSQHVYLKHKIVAADITNGYIETDNISGNYDSATSAFATNNAGQFINSITNIMPLSGPIFQRGIFNIKYQYYLQNISNIINGDIIGYDLYKRNINLLEFLLSGKKSWTYDMHRNRLHIHMDWAEDVVVGDYLQIEAYMLIDDTDSTYIDVWNDTWLKKYATALIKKQWGINLTKFNGVTMPGGITFNGEQILNEAKDEITQLIDDLDNRWSQPPMFMIG